MQARSFGSYVQTGLLVAPFGLKFLLPSWAPRHPKALAALTPIPICRNNGIVHVGTRVRKKSSNLSKLKAVSDLVGATVVTLVWLPAP